MKNTIIANRKKGNQERIMYVKESRHKEGNEKEAAKDIERETRREEGEKRRFCFLTRIFTVKIRH